MLIYKNGALFSKNLNNLNFFKKFIFIKVNNTFYCFIKSKLYFYVGKLKTMLEEYNKAYAHLVAVDCVIFGYEEGVLKLLLFKRQIEPQKGNWSLVGGWVNPDESVEQAARRVLHKITGLDDIYQDQVRLFSKPNRDPGGRVMSAVFYALIDIKEHDKKRVDKFGASWWPIKQLPNLIFDHQEMVAESLEKLRHKAAHYLVGRDLLPNEFTITQLRSLYDSIFMKTFDPGNFRKKILSLKALSRLEKKDTTESKKGAYYYRFKNKDDASISDRIVKMDVH